MEKIITIKMETIEKKGGVGFKYEGNILGKIADKLSDERIEKIKELVNEITSEISEGLAEHRILEGIVSKNIGERKVKIDELQKTLYEMLSDDMKKEVDEFRENINKFETTEERLAYAFQELAKTMDKK